LKLKLAWIFLASALTAGLVVADEHSDDKERVRVMSWNISKDSFVTDPAAFQAVLRKAEADILLLDEVEPRADIDKLRNVLAGLQAGPQVAWNIDYGKSGGRQRGVIASRMALEPLPEFSSVVPYPEADRRHILNRMSADHRSRTSWSMDDGIPINGAIVLHGKRRLLAVVADLQCCGDEPGSWEEFRRRVEMREVRRLVRQVLKRTQVDGIIVAGDFNLVNTAFPLAILAGPYDHPHAGLIPAELYHLDGRTTWTWDGRGTPYPSRVLDFQLYGPQALEFYTGYILDSEDLSPQELKQADLQHKTSTTLSDHRPLVVEYAWR